MAGRLGASGAGALLHTYGNTVNRLLPESLQQRLVKTGGRLVKHAPYFWPLLAESHVNSRHASMTTLKTLSLILCGLVLQGSAGGTELAIHFTAIRKILAGSA